MSYKIDIFSGDYHPYSSILKVHNQSWIKYAREKYINFLNTNIIL